MKSTREEESSRGGAERWTPHGAEAIFKRWSSAEDTGSRDLDQLKSMKGFVGDTKEKGVTII